MKKHLSPKTHTGPGKLRDFRETGPWFENGCGK